MTTSPFVLQLMNICHDSASNNHQSTKLNSSRWSLSLTICRLYMSIILCASITTKLRFIYGSQTDTTWFSLKKRNCYPIPFLSVLMAKILNKNMYSAFCFMVCSFRFFFCNSAVCFSLDLCFFFLLVMSYSFYLNRKVSLILTFYISHFMKAENMLTDS